MARLDTESPASQADYLVTADGLSGVYFTKFSGVVKNFKRPKFVDGLAAQTRTAATGSTEYEDVTLTKNYDPDSDVATISWIQSLEDGTATNITVRPVTRNGSVTFRGDKAWKLSTCRLMKATYPSADLGAGDQVSEIEIVLSVDTGTFA